MAEYNFAALFKHVKHPFTARFKYGKKIDYKIMHKNGFWYFDKLGLEHECATLHQGSPSGEKNFDTKKKYEKFA